MMVVLCFCLQITSRVIVVSFLFTLINWFYLNVPILTEIICVKESQLCVLYSCYIKLIEKFIWNAVFFSAQQFNCLFMLLVTIGWGKQTTHRHIKCSDWRKCQQAHYYHNIMFDKICLWVICNSDECLENRKESKLYA